MRRQSHMKIGDEHELLLDGLSTVHRRLALNTSAFPIDS
jgi:hypothetical protein